VKKWRDERIDVLITPGLTTPAIPHDFAQHLTPSLSYTMIWNIFDFPSGVAPITTVTEDDLEQQPKRAQYKDMLDKYADIADENSVGLPVGCQVVALPWHDELALRVLRELEEVAPWKEGRAKRVQLVTSYFDQIK